VEPHRARELWRVFEPVHAVTYFAPECTEAMRSLGLKGFWMGYFASRAAPLGAVGPGPVAASFFNFKPTMVARALPDAWSFASPAAVIEARRGAAASALRRLRPQIDADAAALVDILGRLVATARERAGSSSRPIGISPNPMTPSNSSGS
jgi:hypothetical protein